MPKQPQVQSVATEIIGARHFASNRNYPINPCRDRASASDRRVEHENENLKSEPPYFSSGMFVSTRLMSKLKLIVPSPVMLAFIFSGQPISLSTYTVSVGPSVEIS